MTYGPSHSRVTAFLREVGGLARGDLSSVVPGLAQPLTSLPPTHYTQRCVLIMMRNQRLREVGDLAEIKQQLGAFPGLS